MDALFDEEYTKAARERFLEKYPALKGKKLVLFAPTYRGTQVRDADYGFEEADLNRLSEELGEDYTIMTRWHPALKNNLKRGIVSLRNCDFGDRIVDFSDYDDVNDLLIACDVLVTDYSSIIFDYFPLNKPVVYFVYDRQEYEGDRGIYYPFDKYVYGRVAENFDELKAAIESGDLEEEKRRSFYNLFLDGCDRHSTERVYRLVFEERNG